MVANMSDQLWVTWSQPDPYGNCTIINNKVTWIWQNQGEDKQNDATIPSASNYTISGLKPYTMYTVCVAAETEGGFGPHGECDNVYTEEDSEYLCLFLCLLLWGYLIVIHMLKLYVVSNTADTSYFLFYFKLI